MSVPRDRMQPDQEAQQTLQASHNVARQAAAAHSDALTKMHSAVMGSQTPDDRHQQLLDAIASLQGGGGQQGAPDNEQSEYSNMPDPGDWVMQDPQGAAAYAEAIMQRFAEVMAEQSMAPAGPPQPDMQSMAGPAVGGGIGGEGGPAF